MAILKFILEFSGQRGLYAQFSGYDLPHSRTDLASGNMTGRKPGPATATFCVAA